MENNISIRQANYADAPELQSCMHAAYSIYQDKIGGIRLPPMDLDYAEEIENYPTWVAMDKNKLIGGLTMMFTDEHASIANIGIMPSAQGRGIGRQLMAFAEQQASEQDYMVLHLATHILLTENAALYSHLGWSETDRDSTRIYMEKIIAS